jgi:hypothetical protein
MMWSFLSKLYQRGWVVLQARGLHHIITEGGYFYVAVPSGNHQSLMSVCGAFLCIPT